MFLVVSNSTYLQCFSKDGNLHHVTKIYGFGLLVNYSLFISLQVVKVYVSIFGDERGKEVALAGLKSKAKYVRGQLGRRMKLRLTPEIRFIEDESLERGSRVRLILYHFHWI